MSDETKYEGVIPAGDIPNCKCGTKARLFVSWSDKNPGRRFFRCEGGRCSYFYWYDEEYAPHLKVMLRNLKCGQTALSKEVEYLRGEVFRLKYIMEHASTLDSVQMEKQLKEFKATNMKMS
ncbi:uncharacterized protein LOC126680240 [Mercurialis annua]|uniref:uncharacterized protein LOC126680240 n=1 Tax=Mercurialis annua TaxID=3986 RepID=UPI00215E1DE9|nr:uncharacterized protein LOC126680240 [Mercurialis annua]